MPSNSAKVKMRAVEGCGARIVFCEPTEAARETTCADVIAKTGATLIHSFENEDVMAGQGTAAVELLEGIPDVDLLMCPIGGGGLLAGTAVAAKSMQPKIKVIAVEPANADDAAQSFRAGRVIRTEKKFTIADGLRTNIGAPNFGIIQRYVDDIATVREDAIIGRVYLPQQDLAKFGVSPSALSSTAPDPTHYRPLLAMEAQRAREFYRAGDALIPLVEEDSQPALWVLLTIYRRLLDKIESRRYDVFSGKVALSTREKLVILGKGFLKRLA